MATVRELKLKVTGWGADLDSRNRPAVSKEKAPPHGTGAHWEVPERQIPRVKILKSVEHRELTPVFGTSCPPRGLSGKIREYAYRMSEGRNAHWLLLLFADRVDVAESALGSLVRGRPHNPLAEMGLDAEWKYHGWRSRVGQHRADVRRWRREALLVLGIGAGLFLFRRFFSGKSRNIPFERAM